MDMVKSWKGCWTWDLLFNVILERTIGVRIWKVILFLVKLFLQGVSVGLIANTLQGHWLAIFFSFGIVLMFYCLAKFFLELDTD